MSGPFHLIRVAGPDAAAFLQGQLTQDLRELEAAGTLLAAWCNPKGRVLWAGRLVALDDGIGLAVPAAMADDLVRRFLAYRLRARVDIAVAADVRPVATADPSDLARLEAAGLLPPQGPGVARAHAVVAVVPAAAPRFVELYGRDADLDRAGITPAKPLSADEWQRALVDAGIPTILPETREKHTPHMLNLDRLGAVSFSKGCYTGQEIVARTEHLGQVKRRLRRFRLEAGEAQPLDPLLADGREVGEVVNAAGGRLLAVVGLEWQEATLTVNGHTAHPLPDA